MSKKLVFIQNDQTLTTSLKVAEVFGKQHKHVLDSIRDILAAENSATNFFQETSFENRGKYYPMYYLNRDGFTLLAMGFTGKKALKFKLAYIDAFNKMEKKLEELLKDGKDKHWFDTREGASDAAKVMASAIKIFSAYAKQQGCRWDDKYFYRQAHIWCNAGAGLPKRGGRDNASVQQLNNIDLLNRQIVTNVLMKGMAKGLHYTHIWAQVPNRINEFLEITFQPPALLIEVAET